MDLYGLTPKDELLYLDPAWMMQQEQQEPQSQQSVQPMHARTPSYPLPYRTEPHPAQTTGVSSGPSTASPVTPEEYRERAYIAASRRTDRSLEAKMESAKRASSLHHKRTGRWLKVDERDVLSEESYREIPGARGDHATDAIPTTTTTTDDLDEAELDLTSPSITEATSLASPGRPSFWMVHESLRSQINPNDLVFSNDPPIYNPYTSTNLRMLFGLPLNSDKVIDLELTKSSDLVKALDKLGNGAGANDMEGPWPARNTVIDGLTFEQAMGNEVPFSTAGKRSRKEDKPAVVQSQAQVPRLPTTKRPKLDHPSSSYLLPTLDSTQRSWFANKDLSMTPTTTTPSLDGLGAGAGAGVGVGGKIDWDDFMGATNYLF